MSEFGDHDHVGFVTLEYVNVVFKRLVLNSGVGLLPARSGETLDVLEYAR